MSYRAGFVGLVGLPNSGKSTLMNVLVGEKVSIVTPKPQTTRRRVIGLLNDDNFQAVMVDAPGLTQSTSGLNKFLHDEAEDVIAQSDALIAVLNIDEDSVESVEKILQLVSKSRKPWMAVIHKTDLDMLHRPRILRGKLESFNVPVVEGSSRSAPEQLRKEIMEKVGALLPVSAGPLYDQDLYTLSSTRELAAEIVREKCFENLHQEVPFGLAVKILVFDESGPVVKIHGEIMVARDSHRPMVIGREGQTLKKIGMTARLEIEKLVGDKVYLDLKVVTKQGWFKMPHVMKELGYVIPTA